MKFLRIVFISVFLIHHSLERTTSDYTSNETITSEESNITTSWWTRTFPIIVTRTGRPRSRPSTKSTTIPIRISRVVSITVPVALFTITILFGFGLIIFSLITHGNGISFLTRTNEHRLR